MLKSNVFILGETKTGKTSLANHLAKQFGLQVVSGSEWVKQRFFPSPKAQEDFNCYVREISAYSVQLLSENPDLCADYIRRKYPIQDGGFVIEGLRNPLDFSRLFRPNVDVAIILYHKGTPFIHSFEHYGVRAIREVLEWMRENPGIISPDRFLEYRINSHGGPKGDDYRSVPGPFWATPCWNLPELYERVTQDLVLKEVPSPETAVVQASISPFQVLVHESVFYNNLPEFNQLIPCSVFGLSSYNEHALTLQVMTNKGAIFSYVPFHRVWHRPPTGPQYELQDIVYARCPDTHITVTRYSALVTEPCQAYLRNPKVWLSAKYVATVDWYRCNDLAHIMALENGQLALLPSHKILIGSGQTLPDYRKLRAEWKVDGSSFEGSDPP